MSPIRLFDTAQRKVVPFEPGPVVRMYVCGITPYDSTHLGHAATYTGWKLGGAARVGLFDVELGYAVIVAMLALVGSAGYVALALHRDRRRVRAR